MSRTFWAIFEFRKILLEFERIFIKIKNKLRKIIKKHKKSWVEKLDKVP